jgi:outer membrane receptor protein involved in Fe transport
MAWFPAQHVCHARGRYALCRAHRAAHAEGAQEKPKSLGEFIMTVFTAASRFALACSASALALAAVPAAAQTTAEADVSEEIIVTASKRAATLQDTPIAVSVTTAESIERSQVRDLIDLQSLVPSLKVGQLQSSANTNFIIRGFGNGANNAGIEPAVGVFIDGVYRSRSGAQIADLPNIERVEVLRGPQSTLFGKNASAGIISIVTKKPQFEFGGDVEASYGNYDAMVLKGMVTGPLSEKIAASVSGNVNKRDGYATYVNLGTEANNRDRWGVRGQLLFVPSETTEIRIIGDYDKIDEICCTVVNIFDGPTGAAVRALGGNVNSNQRFSYDSFANIPSVNDIENYGVSGQLDTELGDGLNLTSISAYRAVRSFTNQDSDFTSADLIGDNRTDTGIDTYTQELRVASDFDGFFNFLIGGFYFKEDIDISSQLLFGRDFRGYANLLSRSADFPMGAYGTLEPTLRLLNGLPAATPTTQFGAQGQGRFENYEYHNDAYSIFGQVDLTPTDRLTLTVGLNYTHDKKELITNSFTTDVFSTIDFVRTAANAGAMGAARTTPCPTGATLPTCNPFLGLRALQFLPPFLNLPNAVESGKTKDSDLAYTLRASYEINDNLNGYATYATGYKGVSFNVSTDSRPFPADFIPGSPAQVPAPAASPIRTALGAALPNNLTTGTRFADPENASVYEIGLKGQYDAFAFNLALFKQAIKGFQGNVFVGTGFVLANADKRSTQGFEIDASITPMTGLNFTASLTYLDAKFDSFPGGTRFNAATNNTGPADLTGETPSGVSKYSIAVGGTYTTEVSDTARVVLHADYLMDSAYTIALGLPFKASPESLNMSATLILESGLEFTLWGRNLTEPKFNPVIFPSVAQSGSLSGYPSPPKTYGGSVRFRF